MEYRISVIVPAHNSEPYLHECLDSIFGQSVRPFEVIVVDDGSTDRTAAVVESYPEPVIYLRNEAPIGPAATRNIGIRRASGNFVAFLDSDDTWYADKLARQVAAFEADPGLDYCLCYVQAEWEDEVAAEGEALKDHPRAQPIPGYATVPLLVRRDAFDRVGLLNPELWSTDAADWFLRAEKAGLKMVMLPEVLVHRRVHTSNMSKRLSDSFRGEWLRMLKTRLDEKRQSGELPAK